jgi:hypothetical protein
MAAAAHVNRHIRQLRAMRDPHEVPQAISRR